MPEIRAGAFELSWLVGRLRECADEAGFAGGSHQYVVAGDALLPARVFDERPDFAERVRVFHGGLIRVDLPFAAQSILIKTNARIIGLPGAVSAKLYVDPKVKGVLRDLRSRRVVRAALPHGRVAIPRVHDYDRHRLRWLTEENIPAPHCTAAQFNWFATMYLRDIYSSAARLRPMFRGGRPHPAIRDALAFLHASGIRIDLPPDRLSPVAMTHGDISATNVLAADDGRFWLIDWEGGRVRPVAHDLGRVCSSEPTLLPLCLAVLRTLDPRGLALPVELQLALGIAADLVFGRRNRDNFIGDVARGNGGDRTAAAAQVDAKNGVRERLLLDLLQSVPRGIITHAGRGAP